MSSRFRLRFVGPVNRELRQEAVRFARWVREWYSFPNPLEVRLVEVLAIEDEDGTCCALRWWQTARGREGVVVEIAVGSFECNLSENGPAMAFATVLAACGRALKYYFQAVTDAPSREDYAEMWGDKLLHAYLTDLTPPRPWPGARLA